MKELSPYLPRTASPSIEETMIPDESIVGEEGFDFWEYWRIIRKRLWLIVVCFFAAVLATGLIVFTATPIYTAAATLLIERKAPQVLNIQGALSEFQGPDEYDYYRTQYEILKSRSLAAQVIQEQGLEKNKFFAGEEKEPGLVAGLWAQAKAWVAQLLASPPKMDGKQETGRANPRTIGAYLNMLQVNPVPRTRLVKVAFSTPDPELSARLANAHIQAYTRQGVELRLLANEDAQSFLEEKLVELKERLEKSEAALNSYRRDKGIISLDDKENVVVERLGDLNTRLTEAEAERIGLEAQVRLIHKRAYDSLPAVVNSTFIQALKGQLTPLEGEYAQLSSRFKPDYPRLSQLKAQLEEIRQRVNQEIQTAVGGLESAYLTAAAKEKELRAKMEEQKATALRLKDISVDYAILSREVDTNRQLYDSVLQRMKEMGVAELRASNVSVIDQAETPLAPSAPNKTRSLILSALLGLLGGIGVVFFLERLDSTLRTPEAVERYLRLPNLAVVPDFLSLNGHGYGYAPKPVLLTKVEGVKNQVPRRSSHQQSSSTGTELVVSHHPLSVITEAYRTLRTAILLSRAGEAPKTILITSTTEREGKTATTVNTAIIFAQMGLRVLVVDADLRRSRCHSILRMERGPGLTELLTGHRTVDEVVRPTTIENLFLLSGGATPPNPVELVGSRKMYDTLHALREEYDCIFVDSPPVMPVSDAVLLSTMVDGVVVVVDGQKTSRNLVRETCSRLSYARAKILGVVLNKVDMHRGDYAYYYHHYSSYYHRPEADI